MNGSPMPRQRTTLDGRPAFPAGQRVRITTGPLRDLRGVVEGSAEDRVLVNAGESFPGICVRIAPALLENLDS